MKKPEIFLRHTADLCFIGQDVIEMWPGKLWLFTRYGRPPTHFAGNGSGVTLAIRRLEARATRDQKLRRHLDELREKCNL